jgi:hypothetical protein
VKQIKNSDAASLKDGFLKRIPYYILAGKIGMIQVGRVVRDE